MPSPFPGMDPFIESSGLWGDFHGSLVAAIRGQLNARLPERFVASMELYLWVEGPGPRKPWRREPDVYVTEEESRAVRSTAAAVAEAPTTIVFPAAARKRRRYVRVIDRESNRVVTAIECLSPSNKEPGDDRDAYLAKRHEYLASRINLVEIDLLRGGTRLPLGEPAPEVGDYYVLVSREWEFPRAGLWSFTIRDALPEVPVPLVPGVSDALLPLRPCIDRAYDEGRYASRLPYDRPLRPRLHRRYTAWVRDLLAARTNG